jgi:hypothetical protein
MDSIFVIFKIIKKIKVIIKSQEYSVILFQKSSLKNLIQVKKLFLLFLQIHLKLLLFLIKKTIFQLELIGKIGVLLMNPKQKIF